MAEDKKGLSRRDFLKTTGIATGALVGGGLIGGLVGYNVNKEGQVAGTGGHKGAEGEPAAVSQSRLNVLYEHGRVQCIVPGG